MSKTKFFFVPIPLISNADLEKTKLANGIKVIQDFTIYLNFGLDSFLEVHAPVPIPMVEIGIRIRLVEHISSYYLFFFLCYKILV